MKIRFGFNGVAISGLDKVPTTYELCKMDKRFIYIGTVVDSKGREYPDAFTHVLDPTEFYTVKGTRSINDDVLIMDTESHWFEYSSPILNNLYDKYDSELYVGDVCDGTGWTGEVWHDTYKSSLASTTLYTKNKDGRHEVVKPPKENCFSVPDRYGFRLVLKTPGEPDKHYAFFLGISAFNQWQILQYNLKEGQEVLHSLDPDYTRFLYGEEIKRFEEYPKLVKAYPKSYSNEGFLKLK